MCPNKISSFSTFPGSVKYVEKGGEEGRVKKREGWGGGRDGGGGRALWAPILC